MPVELPPLPVRKARLSRLQWILAGDHEIPFERQQAIANVYFTPGGVGSASEIDRDRRCEADDHAKAVRALLEREKKVHQQLGGMRMTTSQLVVRHATFLRHLTSVARWADDWAATLRDSGASNLDPSFPELDRSMIFSTFEEVIAREESASAMFNREPLTWHDLAFVVLALHRGIEEAHDAAVHPIWKGMHRERSTLKKQGIGPPRSTS